MVRVLGRPTTSRDWREEGWAVEGLEGHPRQVEGGGLDRWARLGPRDGERPRW